MDHWLHFTQIIPVFKHRFPRYVLSALYVVYVVQAGVNTRLLAASRHSNLLNELKNRILLFNTSIFGLGPRNPY